MAKYLIIGGVAGGSSVAVRLRRLSEHDDILLLEKGEHLSYSNCSLPYFFDGTVSDIDGLIMMTPESFRQKFRIEARVLSEAVEVDRASKEVVVKNLQSGETYRECFDKLILSPGMSAFIPPVEGLQTFPYGVVKSVTDVQHLASVLKKTNPKKIAIVGAGFIGVECAESLTNAGYSVSIVEALGQALTQLDDDMAQLAHKVLLDNGVKLYLNEMLAQCRGGKLIMKSGLELDADLLVFATGGKPLSGLAKKAGLELTKSGAILIDHNYLTTDQDIYAIGDAVEVVQQASSAPMHLPLAGPAQKQAYSVASHIHGKMSINNGYLGTSVLKLFSSTVASVGMNEKKLDMAGIKYNFVYIIPGDRVSLMPGVKPLHLKVLFHGVTGKILGAQAVGEGLVEKRIDVIATAMKFHAGIDELKDLELAYAPHFGSAKDPVNIAGYVGGNILSGELKQVPVTAVRGLVESNAFIIDVREEKEYAQGHLLNSVNIPLTQFRDRLSDIPKDKDVYLHCRSGQRSYYVIRALQSLGYNRVYNISGGFLGICRYEYFKDVMENRKALVDRYE